MQRNRWRCFPSPCINHSHYLCIKNWFCDTLSMRVELYTSLSVGGSVSSVLCLFPFCCSGFVEVQVLFMFWPFIQTVNHGGTYVLASCSSSVFLSFKYLMRLFHLMKQKQTSSRFSRVRTDSELRTCSCWYSYPNPNDQSEQPNHKKTVLQCMFLQTMYVSNNDFMPQLHVSCFMLLHVGLR